MQASQTQAEEETLTAMAHEAEANEAELPGENEGDAAEVERSEAPEGEPEAEAPEQGEAAGEASDEGEEEAGAKTGPGEDLSDEQLLRNAAALLFASAEPLTLAKLTQLLDRPRRGRVKDVLTALSQRLELAELPFQVRAIQGGFALMTTPELGPVVERLVAGNNIEKVSAAALETLAVVAYRQPVTKAEIEAIRGVQAGPILRSLVDRGLIKVIGRADVPGAPLQYGTTREFLNRFGLQAIGDLPRDAELAED
ncbi:MAG: SMC-Scp complex subunit ScpB [Planctomycetota bacterium]